MIRIHPEQWCRERAHSDEHNHVPYYSYSQDGLLNDPQWGQIYSRTTKHAHSIIAEANMNTRVDWLKANAPDHWAFEYDGGGVMSPPFGIQRLVVRLVDADDNPTPAGEKMYEFEMAEDDYAVLDEEEHGRLQQEALDEFDDDRWGLQYELERESGLDWYELPENWKERILEINRNWRNVFDVCDDGSVYVYWQIIRERIPEWFDGSLKEVE